MNHSIIGAPMRLSDGRNLPLSRAVRAGDFVLLSGQLALDGNGKLAGDDIETQTRQCLENIIALLNEAGASIDQVIRATVWLTDTALFPGFNRAYAEYFPESPPTRSTVCSGLMMPGALVEIEVTAYSPTENH